MCALCRLGARGLPSEVPPAPATGLPFSGGFKGAGPTVVSPGGSWGPGQGTRPWEGSLDRKTNEGLLRTCDVQVPNPENNETLWNISDKQVLIQISRPDGEGSLLSAGRREDADKNVSRAWLIRSAVMFWPRGLFL